MESRRENNELIATYCGAEWYGDRWRVGSGEIRQFLDNATELEFNSNWNWLMPVWRNLRANLRDIIDRGETETVTHLYEEILSAVGTGDIDYAYEKIVKGIKWWYENK